jgi:mxaJ protein
MVTKQRFGSMCLPPLRSTLLCFIGLFCASTTALAQTESWELRVCAEPHAMPLSHRDGTGYENRIAYILADELGATVTFDWYPQGSDMINLRLGEGHCDLIMGVPDGFGTLMTTLAYYRSPYVFIYRADAGFNVTSLDDAVLTELRIAVQATGIPPHEGLIRRGLAANVVRDFAAESYAARPDPLAPVVKAVADLGLAWGPIAGYYAARSDVPLVVQPVQPVIDPPFSTQVFAMTIGVRRGDDALRDRLGIALAARWDDIQAVLEEYGVVLDPLPRPVISRTSP